MPTIETRSLAIELPDQWSVFEDRGNLIAYGPNESEVIVTSTIINGDSADVEHKRLLESSKLRIGALMQRNASHPDLAVANELSRSVLPDGIGYASLRCISRNGHTTFDQYMLASEHEIVFLTFEAPVAASESRALVHAAVKSAQLR